MKDYFTKEQKKLFEIWLITQDYTLNDFAKKCGCSAQYICSVINGKKVLSATVKETFGKGGYNQL